MRQLPLSRFVFVLVAALLVAPSTASAFPVPSFPWPGAFPTLPGTGTPSGQGVQPAGMELVDANDRPIGRVVGTEVDRESLRFVTAYVAVVVQGRGMLLDARSEGASDVERMRGTAELVFESSDCSGVAYIIHNAFIEASAVGPPGLTVYLPEPGSIPVSKPLGSQILPVSGTCGLAGPGPIKVLPVVPVVDLLTSFTPPFRLIFTPSP